jgi:hypothetical protein
MRFVHKKKTNKNEILGLQHAENTKGIYRTVERLTGKIYHKRLFHN